MDITYRTDCRTEHYPDFSAMLDLWFSQRDMEEKRRQRAKDLIILLNNAVARTEKKLSLQRESLAECPMGEVYRKYGDLITANIYRIKRGDTSFTCTDYYDEGTPEVTVALDPRLSPAQNAQKMYRLYTKSKNAERVLTELADLDMKRVQFACVFTETELSPLGADAVAFYMSANLGEALKPLNKVASGGELARIMLALKNVLAERDHVPTLIFDEVDTGVSGRAAQRVAEKLRSVSQTKQVLCVTHLPQIAALADTHLLIAKGERDGRTFTTVTPLDFEGRKAELARIIGGSTITETTLQSAAEMMGKRT